MGPSSTGLAAYTSLASTPAEGKRNGDTILTKPPSDRPLSSSPSGLNLNPGRKTQLYIRLLAFFIIEMGYIILAAACLLKPIPLKIHLNLSDSEVKGGFTVVFVVWQSLAILMGSYIVTDAFSREWFVQLARLAPGKTDGAPAVVPTTIDRVSTMTSGFLDRTHHLFDGKSSGTFKLAFLTSLLLLALGSLGPGTINAGTTLIDESTTIQISRLVSRFQSANESVQFTTSTGRAESIIRIEEFEHSPFGFKLPPNMLTVVPKVDLATFNMTIEYNSDVVEFHHDCHWEAPQFTSDSGATIVTAAGQQWEGAAVVVDVATRDTQTASSVGPLFPTTDTILEEVTTSAFIFCGGNTSLLNHGLLPLKPYTVDLGSLPVTFSAKGVGPYPGRNIKFVYAPLSSILVCDPHLQITGGRVRVTKDGTLTIIASGKVPIGNIPRSAANLILMNAFQVALTQPDDSTLINFMNDIVWAMFMSNSSTVDRNFGQNIRPLDLRSINQNMDTFMLSAAKAFIDDSGTSLDTHFDLDTVSATVQEQKIALSTTKPLFIVTVVLVAMATVLLFALCKSGLAQKRSPFDLNHVLAVLRENEERLVLLLAAQNRESEEI